MVMNIVRLVWFLRYLKRFGSLSVAKDLSKHPKIESSLLYVEGGILRHRALPGIDLLSKEWEFVLKGAPLLDDLINGSRGEIGIERGVPGSLRLSVSGVSLKLHDWEEIFIAHEVFVGMEYGLWLGQPHRVIDVGANVGTASLFFASRPDVVSVEAFELFPDTADRMQENLLENPHLAGKIRVNRFGLAESDGEFELDYHPEVKGSVGLFGVHEHAGAGREAAAQKRKVKVEDASGPFRRCTDGHSELPVVAKIDCEGAEYQIIGRLAADGLLDKVAAFMIEWHLHGPDEIRDHLLKAGHAVWTTTHPGAKHGMIYSVNRKR